MTSSRYPCTTPQICGVTYHRDSSNCRGTQISATHRERVQSLQSISSSSISTDEKVMRYLEMDADKRVVQRVQDTLNSGEGRWVEDPQVDGVYGLHLNSDPANRVVAIVYLEEGDFEVDEEWAFER